MFCSSFDTAVLATNALTISECFDCVFSVHVFASSFADLFLASKLTLLKTHIQQSSISIQVFLLAKLCPSSLKIFYFSQLVSLARNHQLFHFAAFIADIRQINSILQLKLKVFKYTQINYCSYFRQERYWLRLCSNNLRNILCIYLLYISKVLIRTCAHAELADFCSLQSDTGSVCYLPSRFRLLTAFVIPLQK